MSSQEDRDYRALSDTPPFRAEGREPKVNVLFRTVMKHEASSLQLAFGSMQKNVEVYQATLHTGLDRMHHLGYQGEVLFSTLVNRLAQQVGRESGDTI